MGFTDDWEELGIQEFNEEKIDCHLSLVIVYYFLEPKTKKEIFSKPKISVLRFLVPSLAYLALIVFLASAFSHRAFG